MSTTFGPTAHLREHLRGTGRVFQAGAPPADALRLDLNEGPYGPTPGAIEAIARTASGLNRYPDASGTALRRALAETAEVDPERIVLGPGANGVMAAIVRATLGPGEAVAYSWPGFPSYLFTATNLGGRGIPVPVGPAGADDLDGLAAAAGDARVLFLSTPANPTGHVVLDGLDRFVDAASGRALVVIDEAYTEFAPPRPTGADLIRAGLPLVSLRTFSKVYGLAGLRIGYAIVPAGMAGAVRACQETFETSALAQAAALASLAETDEIARRVSENAEVRERLRALLDGLGLDPYPSATNFVTCRPADPTGFVGRLAERGIIVRGLAVFGDPDRVRIGVPSRGDAERVLAAIRVAAAG